MRRFPSATVTEAIKRMPIPINPVGFKEKDLKKIAESHPNRWQYGRVSNDQDGDCFAIWIKNTDPKEAKVTFEQKRAIVCLDQSQYWFDLDRLYENKHHDWAKHLIGKSWITPVQLFLVQNLYHEFG